MLRRAQTNASTDEPDGPGVLLLRSESIEPSGIERRRHPRVRLDEPEPEPVTAKEDRRSGDRRTADRGSYSGPERRSGERRSMDELRGGVQWAAAPAPKNNLLGAIGAGLPRGFALKPARAILLLVALLAGVLAAFLVAQSRIEPVPSLQPAPGIVQVLAEPAPQATIEVLVATETIGIGQKLSPTTVAWENWPQDSVRPEYITRAAAPQAIAEMAGAMARFELFDGEPIREKKLARAGQGYLSAVLGTGMRGVSVSVMAQSASGGFVTPNDHVDVVLTRQSATGQITETIIYNARVLAIGTRLGEVGSTGEPTDPQNPRGEIFADQAIATLELDASQAEVLVNGSTLGSLALVLRSMTDFATKDAAAPIGANQAIRLSSPFWNQSNYQGIAQ